MLFLNLILSFEGGDKASSSLLRMSLTIAQPGFFGDRTLRLLAAGTVVSFGSREIELRVSTNVAGTSVPFRRLAIGVAVGRPGIGGRCVGHRGCMENVVFSTLR